MNASLSFLNKTVQSWGSIFQPHWCCVYDSCTPLQEHSVFANAPRVARSMALLAKKRQARKSQVGSMVMVEFFEKINNHNDHLRLRLLLGYEFWQTDGGNFIPYSQSRADFMKVVSWNSTPQGTLNIWVLLRRFKLNFVMFCCPENLCLVKQSDDSKRIILGVV